MESCCGSVVDVYGKLINEDKKKRREIHETFIKGKEIENIESNVNIVNKTISVTKKVKVTKVEMSPHERFEMDEKYNHEMEEMWETTFQKIDTIATELSSDSVGIQTTIIYGTTYMILTPFAAMGLCAIGVGKYIFR